MKSFPFDVALSFAGEDRAFVESVAAHLKVAQVKVFYDRDAEVYLWGKDLAETLDSIYQHQSRYVVFFISSHYAEKMWTRHERRSALARALLERREYILPARFDATPLPGVPPSIAYISLATETPESFAAKLIAKIESRTKASSLLPLVAGFETPSLRRKAEDRYQSAADFASAIEAVPLEEVTQVSTQAAQARHRKVSPITWRRMRLWFITLSIVFLVLGMTGWAIYKYANETAPESPFTGSATDTVTAFDTTLVTRRPFQGLLDDYNAALTRFDNLPPIDDAQRRCIESALSDAESRLSEGSHGRFQDVERVRWDLNHCAATSGPSRGRSPIIATVQALLTEEARYGRCPGLEPLPTDGVRGHKTSVALQRYVRCHALALWQIDRLETLGDYATIGLYLVQERQR